MRNLRENKHNKVCDLTGQSAFKTFFFNADGLLIDVMKRSASFDRVYSYDDLDRLASWTGGAYTHDVAGNVTRIERGGRPTLDLSWNSRYQLVSVATNGAFAESYTYDALGRRVSTTTREGTTRHVYDNNWQVIADIDEQGNVIASYVWGEGIDNLLAVTIGNATYYALTDVQGTVWGYVDSQNNIVARWTYDAWGNVLSEYVAPSAAALARLRYRFQGREWSAATGLVNFRMRWYDAETGRWLSKDPIGLSGGLNLYAFCGGDAINLVDPYGEFVPVFLYGPGIMIGAGAVSSMIIASTVHGGGIAPSFYVPDNFPLELGTGIAAQMLLPDLPLLADALVHASRRLIDTAKDFVPGEHSKNARPSSREKHQKGNARRKRDQERSKQRRKGGNRVLPPPLGDEDDGECPK